MVAFELWHPFSTGMERVKMLQGLRESCTFPEGWEAQHPQARLLLGSLLGHQWITKGALKKGKVGCLVLESCSMMRRLLLPHACTPSLILRPGIVLMDLRHKAWK